MIIPFWMKKIFPSISGALFYWREFWSNNDYFTMVKFDFTRRLTWCWLTSSIFDSLAWAASEV
jgi:hypothetical protein